MQFLPKPSEEDIEELGIEATIRATEASKWPGMSYEQGVRDALIWVLGEAENAPFEEE